MAKPIRPRTYVTIENAVSTLLARHTAPALHELATKVKQQADKGDTSAAIATVAHWNPPPLPQDQRNHLYELMTSALFYGVSHHIPPEQSRFIKQLPLAVKMAERQAETIATTRLKTILLRDVRLVAGGHEDSRRHPLFKCACQGMVRAFKADDPYAGLADAMNAVVMGTGRVMTDVASNLTTSRLVSYGFLSQAQAQGATTYEITAILDDVTCPVCKALNGRKFDVTSAQHRAEQMLGTDNPEDLRQMAPFPSQRASDVAKLSQMSSDQLMNSGWAIPPFHPSCRCLLVPVDAQLVDVDEDMTGGPGLAADDEEENFWKKLFGLLDLG
jgi:hypothetical protein